MTFRIGLPTIYGGIRMRSRLEARWAVFFDTLHMPWEYEPTTRELPGGKYRPDFFLPSMRAWFEVKGTYTEDRRFHDLAAQSRLPVHVAMGTIPKASSRGVFDGWHPEFSITTYFPIEPSGAASDNGQAFCLCSHCGSPGIAFEGRPYRLECPCRGPYYTPDSRLRDAYNLAASVRVGCSDMRQHILDLAANDSCRA